jgi:hypothetical protein
MASIHELTAAELAAGYSGGELSPVEATRALLERIDAWEPRLNAMYRIDRDNALAAAKASEARWRKKRPLSPLDGVPVTLKENIYTKGDPAPIGTAANLPAAPQAADAPPAARLREAGCVFLGKTTMPDYGMLSAGVSSVHGVTRNPWNPSRNTSGSSSGAGAAAAAGYAPLHLGTDIGGSVRLPATHCGIFALKPSLGRVPVYPPYMGRVTGPMTRDVEAAALLMNWLTLPIRAISCACRSGRWITRGTRVADRRAQDRLPCRHAHGPPGASGSARGRAGGGEGAGRRRCVRRGAEELPYAGDARRHGTLFRSALPQRLRAAAARAPAEGAAVRRGVVHLARKELQRP